MDVKTADIIVKVLAVLAYINAAATLLGGIALILGGSLFAGIIAAYASSVMPGLFGGMIGGLFVVFGIVAIAFAVLDFFIGRGLWYYQNWARILMIIMGALMVLSIFGLKIVQAIVGALIVYFFGFDETVVGMFQGKMGVMKKAGKRSRK